MGLFSVLILLGAANGVVLAVLIAFQQHRSRAHAFLAALLLLVSLRLSIYVLGFAGVYDTHPWLTFLPLDLSAGFAPLLWLYTRAQIGRLPESWRLHLMPAAVQFSYQLVCFTLPSSAKWDWYSGDHLRIVEPVAMGAIVAAAAAYVAACWLDQARYQAWLDTQFSNRDPWRLTWLRSMIATFAVLLAGTVAAGLWHLLVQPLNYVGRTPVIFGFCVLVYILGLLGWRHGTQTYPPQTQQAPDVPEPAERRTDYVALATGWVRRIEAQGWWREDGLTLGEVARRLGTSERSLSRALNEGAGCSFSALINGMRVKAIQRCLADPDDTRDLLTLALEHGFASKASFNRAFRNATGMTPTQWRRKIRQGLISAQSEATQSSAAT